MKATFFLLLMFLSLYAFSQKQEVDSLREILNSYKNIDTNRIQMLLGISGLLVDSDPKGSLIAAQNAKSIAQKLKNRYLEARSLHFESEAYFNMGEANKAINNCKQAIIILKQLGIAEKEFACLNTIGKYFSRTGKNDSAIYYYNLSIEKARTLKDTSVIRIPLDNISVAYSDLGDNDKAIETRKKSLKIYTQKQDKKGMGISLMWIGSFIREKGDFQESLKYYNEALKTIPDSNAEYKAYCHGNIGVIYRKIKDYDKALDNYRSSLKIILRINDRYNEAMAYHFIANIYYDQFVFDSAYYYFKKAIDIRKDIKDYYGLTQSYLMISDLYNKDGKASEAEKFLDRAIYYNEIIKNDNNKISLFLAKGNILYTKEQFAEANHYYEKALAYAKKFSSLENIKIAYQNISNCYQNLGNFSSAYNYLLEYNKVSDSLLNKEKIEAISDLNVKYETEKKQQQIELLNKDKQLSEVKNQRQKTQMLFGGVIAVLLLISTIVFFYLRQKQQKTLYEKQVSQAELGTLKARMEPHFIGSALTSIQSYLLNNNPEEAAGYLTKFSKLVSDVLNKSGETEILLSEELEIVKNYLEVEKFRVGHFEYSIHVDENIDTDNTLFPSLMLQPFAENTIKHAFNNIGYEGLLKIAITLKENMLHCVIEDNGKGRNLIQEDNSKKKKSVSSDLNNKRIGIYNRLKKQKAYFNITDKVQGTLVELVVPYTQTFTA